MMTPFSKMHGLGNDFVVFESLTQNIHINPTMVRKITDRHTGIGCDQLLVIGPPGDGACDFSVRYFNADGSEAEQCGNGLRCAARYVFDKKFTGKRSLQLQTATGVMAVDINDDNSITANMGQPELEPAQVPFSAAQRSVLYPIEVDGDSYQIGVVSMGNPHAVLQVPCVASAQVAALGPKLEQHPRFCNRVNVGFMQIENRQQINLRVHERGAGETKACGTGACAAVVAGIQQQLLESLVRVSLPGGALTIEWPGEGHALSMTGPAVNVFNGYIKI